MDESGLSYQIVMTKADRLKPAALEKTRAKLAAQVRKRPACHPEIRRPAPDAGTGIAELRQALAAFTLTAAAALGQRAELPLDFRGADPHGLRAFPEGLKPRCLRSTTPTPSTGCAPRGP